MTGAKSESMGPSDRGLIPEPRSNGANCASGDRTEISRLVQKMVLVPRLQAATKIGAIKELVDKLHEEGAVTDSLRFLQAVLVRDDIQSTVIGEDIALPHARSSAAAQLSVAVGMAPQPISYPSADDYCDVQTIALVAVPAGAADAYLALLGALASAFGDASTMAQLWEATTSSDLIQILSNGDMIPSLPQKG